MFACFICTDLNLYLKPFKSVKKCFLSVVTAVTLSGYIVNLKVIILLTDSDGHSQLT